MGKASIVSITEHATDAAGRDQTAVREAIMTDVNYASVEVAEDGTASYYASDGSAVDAEGKAAPAEPEPEPEPEDSEPATPATESTFGDPAEFKFNPTSGEPLG